MVSGSAFESEIDRLYGAALDQFTAARDTLARTLRADGDRGAAAQAKALRKPSLGAWALNQVTRSDRGAAAELLGTGDRLREAQRRLLAGEERGALRDATAAHREALERVLALARDALERSGHAAGATQEAKLRQTLQSLLGDEDARERFAAGRLVREGELGDLGLGLDLGEAPVATRPAGSATEGQERTRREAEERLRRAREKHAELAAAHEALAREAADARAEAERAAREAQRTAATAERAAEKAQRAGERVARAAERVGELEGRA